MYDPLSAIKSVTGKADNYTMSELASAQAQQL